MSESYISVSVHKEVIRLSNGYCEYCLHPENYYSVFKNPLKICEHSVHIFALLKNFLEKKNV